MSGRDKVLHGQIKRKLVRSVTCQSRTSQDDSDQTDQDHFVFCSSDSMSPTVFPLRNFFTEQIFVLVSKNIIRLS